MADAPELAARTAGRDVERWALVLNARGAQRALEAGHRPAAVRRQRVRHPQRAQRRAHDRCRARRAGDDRRRRCPPASAWRSRWPPRSAARTTARSPPGVVLAAAERALAAGVSAVSLADTIGTAIPKEVADLVTATDRPRRRPARRRAPPRHPRARRRQRADGDRRRRRAASTAASARSAAARSRRAPAATWPSRTSSTCSRSPASTPASTSTPSSRPPTLACELVGRPVESHVGKAGPRFRTPCREPSA